MIKAQNSPDDIIETLSLQRNFPTWDRFSTFWADTPKKSSPSPLWGHRLPGTALVLFNNSARAGKLGLMGYFGVGGLPIE